MNRIKSETHGKDIRFTMHGKTLLTVKPNGIVIRHARCNLLTESAKAELANLAAPVIPYRARAVTVY